MKKLSALLLAAVMLFGLTACGEQTKKPEQGQEQKQEQKTDTPTSYSMFDNYTAEDFIEYIKENTGFDVTEEVNKKDVSKMTPQEKAEFGDYLMNLAQFAKKTSDDLLADLGDVSDDTKAKAKEALDNQNYNDLSNEEKAEKGKEVVAGYMFYDYDEQAALNAVKEALGQDDEVAKNQLADFGYYTVDDDGNFILNPDANERSKILYQLLVELG